MDIMGFMDFRDSFTDLTDLGGGGWATDPCPDCSQYAN